jgi:DNA-binding transcriptional ArsR family regulator
MGTLTSGTASSEAALQRAATPLGSPRDASSGTLDAGPLPHPERAGIELAAVLHALSDPMRLRIVAELAAVGGERACNSFDLPIVKSTCTHHFKVLREAGLIRQRLVGTSKVNSLRAEDLEARFPGLLTAVLAGARLA